MTSFRGGNIDANVVARVAAVELNLLAMMDNMVERLKNFHWTNFLLGRIN